MKVKVTLAVLSGLVLTVLGSLFFSGCGGDVVIQPIGAVTYKFDIGTPSSPAVGDLAGTPVKPTGITDVNKLYKISDLQIAPTQGSAALRGRLFLIFTPRNSAGTVIPMSQNWVEIKTSSDGKVLSIAPAYVILPVAATTGMELYGGPVDLYLPNTATADTTDIVSDPLTVRSMKFLYNCRVDANNDFISGGVTYPNDFSLQFSAIGGGKWQLKDSKVPMFWTTNAKPSAPFVEMRLFDGVTAVGDVGKFADSSAGGYTFNGVNNATPFTAFEGYVDFRDTHTNPANGTLDLLNTKPGAYPWSNPTAGFPIVYAQSGY